ncbi:hypothetical protein [Maricaulis maris]|uniref:hypothetical protein n=1 Tax=Maricaulis maris TaxID=74318 RepID=UPI003BAD8BFB
MRRIAIGVLIGISMLVVGAILLFALPTDPIDRCLDHGGRWNYDAAECECTYADRAEYERDPSGPAPNCS